MRPVLWAFCLLLAASISAQTATNDLPYAPRHQVKVSLIDCIDPFSPSFLLSYEQPFAGNFALLAEAGISTSFNGVWVTAEALEGYKIRTEVRWYDKPMKAGDRFYMGLQTMFKKTSRTDLSGTFCREDCAYFQDLTYSRVSRVAALHGSIGVSLVVSPHFVVDIGAFGGWRIADRRNEGIPDDATLLGEGTGFFQFDQPGRYSIPSVGFAFRAGFGW